ncbi:MAG TPA: LysR substrate-binding domain-containing protein, partial [Acetobacteraceae bacterium]|nr:LysR substrate-binding domain-containing protein [Acetobacteraceae bacterium]
CAGVLAAAGVDLPAGVAGITFSDLMLVQTAAIAGQGIMMGDEITCAGVLAAGQLVTPFSTRIKASGGYYLLRSRQRRANPAMLAFTRWLNALFVRVGRELSGAAAETRT